MIRNEHDDGDMKTRDEVLVTALMQRSRELGCLMMDGIAGVRYNEAIWSRIGPTKAHNITVSTEQSL